jgi:CheY-like chemotaxis protein
MLLTEIPTCLSVVEDDVDVRELLDRLFKKRGFRVVSADNGLQGTVLAAMEQPDIMVLDLHMPSVGSLPMLRALACLDWFKHVALVVLTGAYPKGHPSLLEARCLGAVVLRKPFKEGCLHAAALEAQELATCRSGDISIACDEAVIAI